MRLSLLEAAESTVCCSPTIWCCLHPLNKGVNQYALDRFAAGCGQAEAKINTKRPRYYVSPETQVCASSMRQYSAAGREVQKLQGGYSRVKES